MNQREAENDKIIYACPMHAEVQQEIPGLCPKCGMKLIAQERKHAGHTPEMFIKKFWISFILTIPVVVYSGLPQKFFGWSAPSFAGSEYLTLVLSSIVFFYGGWIFLIGAWREIKSRLPGMMTLIALAISVAYAYSVLVVFILPGRALFWELTTLITVMLLGHWMEMRSVRGTLRALNELSKLLPDTAEVMRGGGTEIVPIKSLKVSDIVFVRPGGKIPADGIVIEGKSEVDESMITGESRPVGKSKGKEVIAGTINIDGSLKIKITKIGENTFLSGVIKLVKEAQASKSRLQILADKAAYYLTLIAITAGISTFIVWLFYPGTFAFAVERAVAVLVIACPHALGLAIPLVASISTTIAAKEGFLVRQRLALESARNIDVVLFDKTGTLTKGEYGVDKIITTKQISGDQLLQLAASVDSHSEHFIAKAIVKEAKNKGINLLEVKDFKRIPGKGTTGKISSERFSGGKDLAVLVGSEAILKEAKIALPEEIKKEIQATAKQGKTIIYVVLEDKLVGAIALGDIIREESKQAIKELNKLGIKSAMITGDSEEVASWVAGELGISEYFYRVLPQEKAEKVKMLQKQGLKVAMVGDGINDAPALVQADLGVAIGAGTNVAVESAGIILVRNDPRDIAKIIHLSKAAYSKMLQNIFWATGYNVVAIPLAAGVLAFKGILLNPALGALFMSLSTVIVAFNAMLLWKIKLTG